MENRNIIMVTNNSIYRICCFNIKFMENRIYNNN